MLSNFHMRNFLLLLLPLLKAGILGLEAGIWATRLGFGLWGWIFGFEAGFWSWDWILGLEAGIWVLGLGIESGKLGFGPWGGGGDGWMDGEGTGENSPHVWKHRSSTPMGPLPCFPFNLKHNLLRQGTGTSDHLTLLRLFFYRRAKAPL